MADQYRFISGVTDATYLFDTNPDPTQFELATPVDPTPPVSAKKATSATDEGTK